MARSATIHRQTNETDIWVELNLDGQGQHEIATGIGFLDHMLCQLARHGLFDIKIKASADLHIDDHHCCEDVGITLGQAFAQALGERRGIYRYGHAYVPMDEALSRVALDLSGRPFLVWKVLFTRDKIGKMDTELFREWFYAFAQHSGTTLHVEVLAGDNQHHIIESCYKALARALRQAVALDARLGHEVASTKGTLGGNLAKA
jgi:imidazoleglycerol-phosphate dehydratase